MRGLSSRRTSFTPAPHPTRTALSSVLVGCGAGVNDVRRELKPLIKGWVPEQAVQALHHRQDCLSAARGVTAKDGRDTVLNHEALGAEGEGLRLGAGIIDHWRQLATIHATRLIDFL